MSLVLPIVFFAIGVGLFAHKMTPRLWALLAAWITIIIAVNFFKG